MKTTLAFPEDEDEEQSDEDPEDEEPTEIFVLPGSTNIMSIRSRLEYIYQNSGGIHARRTTDD